VDLQQSLVDARKLQVQRTVLLTVLAISAAGNIGLVLYNATRPVEVVLQPILQRPVTISSSYVSRDYLEMVTRDTAYAVLNRTPQSIDYWMNAVLKITDPAYYGAVKARLLRSAQVLRGRDITQMIEIETIDVAPDRLNSEISGVIHVYEGQREVSHAPVRYHFDWTYRGLSLKLAGFGDVRDPSKEPQETPTDTFVERGGQ
jgi:conjugal transfer pilus assembly protein TraE